MFCTTGALGDVPQHPVLLLGDPALEQTVWGTEARHGLVVQSLLSLTNEASSQWQLFPLASAPPPSPPPPPGQCQGIWKLKLLEQLKDLSDKKKFKFKFYMSIFHFNFSNLPVNILIK